MTQYLPNKKVFGVALVAISVFVFAVFYEPAPKNYLVTKDNILKTVAHASVTFEDTDGDGLSNWMEAIYETDPNNPDTDGDGKNDGDEYITEKASFNIEPSDSVYAAINKLGTEIENTPDPVSGLSQEPTQYRNPYTTSDLETTESTEGSAAFYIGSMFLILSDNTNGLDNEPLEIVQKWLETYSQKYLNELQTISFENKETSRSLMEIPVPKEFQIIHVSIANNLYKTGLSLDEIEYTTLDPTKGFFASANYANYQSKYMDHVLALVDLYNEMYEQ